MNIQKISIALLILFLMVGAAVMYFSAGCKDEVIDELEGRKIEQRMKKYILTPMYFDASAYSPEEKALLKTLIEAGKLADEIFWGQTYYDNLRLRDQIVSTRNEDDPVRKFFFTEFDPRKPRRPLFYCFDSFQRNGIATSLPSECPRRFGRLSTVVMSIPTPRRKQSTSGTTRSS